MRTGRLIISRGHQLDKFPPRPTLAAAAAAADAAEPAPPQPPLPYYPEIDERLTALERLARLFEQGALSPQEFAAEKALVLGRFGDEAAIARPAPVSFVPARPSRRRQSLLGRLFGWKLIPIGLAAGLAFSYASQPAETANFFRDLAGLAGF